MSILFWRNTAMFQANWSIFTSLWLGSQKEPKTSKTRYCGYFKGTFIERLWNLFGKQEYS